MASDIRCPICAATCVYLILERENVPVHQNLVFKSQAAAMAVQRGDLWFFACDACGFVFNAAFDAARLAYGPEYENTQLASPVFQAYVGDLVQHMIGERNVRGARIVEVGCGKGGFLRALVAAEGANNTGLGFDPSYVGPAVDLGGRLRFERRFYDASCTDVPADVVVARHVIEHVPDPLGFLGSIASALRCQTSARLFLETPCVRWILRHDVIWDVFYEHCSLFTAESLSSACARAGFAVESARHVFGGQYLWLEASRRPPEHVVDDPGDVPRLARQFAEHQRLQTARWRAAVAKLAVDRSLVVWGAGAKGATFANLVDPQREYVRCLVDINPAKQGGYVPGTGHPIVAPAELAARVPSCALVLNPNYAGEVQALLRDHGLGIDVLSIGDV